MALINKHKSGCMMDRETNIRAHYIILYDVIVHLISMHSYACGITIMQWTGGAGEVEKIRAYP